MAGRSETGADRLRRLRKHRDFAPVWTNHAEQRLDEYGLDRLSVERIVRGGSIGRGEPDVYGREPVHVAGTADGAPVEVVVEVVVTGDGAELVRIITLKPKPRRRR